MHFTGLSKLHLILNSFARWTIHEAMFVEKWPEIAKSHRKERQSLEITFKSIDDIKISRGEYCLSGQWSGTRKIWKKNRGKIPLLRVVYLYALNSPVYALRNSELASTRKLSRWLHLLIIVLSRLVVKYVCIPQRRMTTPPIFSIRVFTAQTNRWMFPVTKCRLAPRGIRVATDTHSIFPYNN